MHAGKWDTHTHIRKKQAKKRNNKPKMEELWMAIHVHPKTLFEIAMVLSTNSGSFPSNSNV